MKIYYYRAFIIKIYNLGLSFLPLYKAKRETLATLTALKPAFVFNWRNQVYQFFLIGTDITMVGFAAKIMLPNTV